MENSPIYRLKVPLIWSSFLFVLSFSSCQNNEVRPISSLGALKTASLSKSSRANQPRPAVSGAEKAKVRKQDESGLLGHGAPLNINLGAANGLAFLLGFGLLIALVHLNTARSIEKTMRDYRSSQKTLQGLRRQYNGLD